MREKVTCDVLGLHFRVTNMEAARDEILENIDKLRGKYICFSNVHTTVMSYRNSDYRRVQNGAAMILPDGRPISFVQKWRGADDAEQVAGPDMMPFLWKETENTGKRHFFYGGSPETIEKLRAKLEMQYPGLEIAGMISPPYRELTKEEDQAIIDEINQSKADFLWIGLGAPKQENWMAEHKDKVNCVMFGVGAAFDFHAGTVKRAPKWMRTHYLEWLFRLIQDPKRLWSRYVNTNIRFMILIMREVFSGAVREESDKKELLIYAHYYHPDVAATGQILAELAEGLLQQFRVTVICTVPSYTGKITKYYRKHKYYYENIRGVNVLRIRVPEFRKGFMVSRLFNIISYFFGAISATLRVGKVDYIFAISQPPIMGGMLGRIGKKIKKARFIYNIQDFNPEQTQAVGVVRTKFLLNLMMKVDKASCSSADKVIVVGRDMIETLKKRYENDRRHEMPSYCFINNWTDDVAIKPLKSSHSQVAAFRERYGLTGKFVFMYSGNIGLYYDLQNIIKVMKKFSHYKDVAFAFIGAGSVLEQLQEYKESNQLENVVFIPYQNKRDLVYSLNAGDVHLVVSAKGIKGVSVPSKLYGVMSAGKAVMGVLEKDSEARLIIEESGCGLLADPGDYQRIEEIIEEYLTHREDLFAENMGHSGREYLQKYLTKDVSISKYAEEILSCKGRDGEQK